MNAAIGETVAVPTITTGDPIFALCASPNFAQDKTLFAARASGLWRSADAGRTWTDALESLPRSAPLPALAVAIAPDYPRNPCIFAGASDGVLVSADDGMQWRTVLLPQPPPVVSAIVVSPSYNRDSLVFAATLEEGVFRSTDGGRRWASANFGLLDLSVYCLVVSPAFAQDETLFAGASTGVFISRNGGRAWRETTFPPELGPVLALAVSPRFGSDHTLFAATETNGLFRSQDGGKNWMRLPFGESDAEINTVVATLGKQDAVCLVAAAGEALWYSDDTGESWQQWRTDAIFANGVDALCAPMGLDSGKPVIVGDGKGHILRLEKPS